MGFDDVLAQVLAILQRQGRVSYGALKRRFALDDAYLDDLKTELIEAQRLAVDEDGRILVWIGTADASPAPPPAPPGHVPPAALAPPEAERRQLTVMVCDLVDSTPLASQLDPEDLLAVIHAYQTTCTAVIQRFAGEIAQHLGDGLLVYFGYPQAHDDDAQRAVRAGLGLVEAMGVLNHRLAHEQGIRLAIRVGIHTGLVVVGAMGEEGRQERLALGETPHIAAHLQGLAVPDTVVLSEPTARLVHGSFLCQLLRREARTAGAPPVAVYQVVRESGAYSRVDVVQPHTLTPLVGREQEVSLLLERWAQAKEGLGQVVLVSGEAGIGKSRLVQALKDHVAHAPHVRLECRGFPYYQHTAFYPLVDLWERALHVQREDTAEEKLTKLERALAPSRLPLADTVPLLAALLSLPVSAERYRPLALTPHRQKQRTLDVLLALVLERAAEHPVVLIMEDLHWVDPSTLEFLTLLLDQGPTAAVLTLLTCRSEFHAPWGLRTHLTPLALQRLPPAQVHVLVERVTGGKSLPPEVMQQVVTKTDGVPLFVEELTKMVLESGWMRETSDHYELLGPMPTMAIPTTLQDLLMARLDRLATGKGVAQLGATLGRTFAYDVLQAVAARDAATLQHGLHQLVEAELLYQRGTPPQATYLFKHALIQDAAYQSLLKSTRQQYHQRIAQVLEAQFPATAETQPELLAHHYTEAGCREQALGYWQRAGERALQRSANPEAVQHLTRGLQVLATLPETPARAHQELGLQMALGPALMATKGWATPEVEQVYARAHALCTQAGDTPHLFPALRGLCWFYFNLGVLPTAWELGQQLARLVRHEDTRLPRLEVHEVVGATLSYLGEYAAAQAHLQQGIALMDPLAQRALLLRHSVMPGVVCLALTVTNLWCLGYPAQAERRSQEALALASALDHPQSLAYAQLYATFRHLRCREVQAVQAQAEALLTLATAHGFPLLAGYSTFCQGWVRAWQSRNGAGLAQMHQGMAAILATGQLLSRSFCLVLLAEAAGHAGQGAEGLRLLTEALAAFETSGRGDLLAEAYRLQAECLLHQAVPDTTQAEASCQRALAIARRQQAKAWELRAATSLSRLWQQQGKHTEAYDLLAPIYGWFTEGLDTADLQDAKALLEDLGG